MVKKIKFAIPKPILVVWAHIKALRPHQWSKNLFVFAGIVFVGKANQNELFANVAMVFIAFCAVSSAGYLINDLIDMDKDRNHQKKKHRPIASGKVAPITAATLAVVLLASAIAFSTVVSSKVGGIVILYALVTFSYSLFFKNIVLLDVFVLSLGFVIRVFAGTLTIGEPSSPWIVVCTLLLSLFLAINKRRSELLANPETAGSQRKNLKEYTTEMLSEMSTVVTAALILAYWLYTFFVGTDLAKTIAPGTPQRPYMMLTLPVVIYALFRYLFLVHKKKGGESPDEIIFSDIPFIISVALWVVLIVLIIYRPLWLTWIDVK